MPSSKELREIAKDLKIRGYSKMNKAQLTGSIEQHARGGKPTAELKISVPSEVSAVKNERTGDDVKRTRSSKSPWVQFCQEYAKTHGVTYKEAMSKREEYSQWKSSKTDVAGNQVTEEREPLLAEEE